MCEAFHILPYPGGLFDQPAPVMLRMEKVLLARQAAEEADANKDAAEKKLMERLGAPS